MHTPAESIVAYLRAKDGNRPHLMAQAFTANASLRMEVLRGGITFPPLSSGREAIADTLVRRFGQAYENVYTFCLSRPPAPAVTSFSCGWLVAMTEKQGHAVRVGCGRYDWEFDPTSGLAGQLSIRIDAMQSLPPAALPAIMRWVTSLPYPWCTAGQVFAGAPALDGVSAVLACLAAESAFAQAA